MIVIIIMQFVIVKFVLKLYGYFSQISTNVLQTWTTAVLMLCVLTLRVVLVVSAILASVEMVYTAQVSHSTKYYDVVLLAVWWIFRHFACDCNNYLNSC